MFLKLTTFLLLIGHISTSPFSRSKIAQPKSTSADYLLPTHLKPLRYLLDLEPNFTTDTFTGSVTIEFEVLQSSDNIILHAKELVIRQDTITVSSSADENPPTVFNATFSNDDKEFYTIFLNNNLTSEILYNVTIGSFQGILNSDNDGFYLAKYTDKHGNERLADLYNR